MNVPDDLRYSKDHEWARLDGTTVRIGITDYAQDTLGEVVYIELPEVGTEVGAGEKVGDVDSSKATSEIYAPIAGVVVEVNVELSDTPSKLNEDPYGEGWICVIELADASQVEDLLDAAGYRALVEG